MGELLRLKTHDPGAEADAFAERAANLTDTAALEAEMSAAIRRLGYHGFDAWAVTRSMLVNPYQPQNLWAADYAPDVIKTFVKLGLAESCPITALAAQTATPFDYVAELKTCPQSKSVRWQLRTLRFFGVAHAWIVPLNTVEQMRGVTAYLKGSTPDHTAHFLATRHDVHLLAVAFIDAFTRVNAPSKPAPVTEFPALSAREVDCLQWVARGKTNWEVSVILSVSENTVRYHLKNVFRKLGANSRSSAVMRAIQAGLIEP